jgi:hypothetical protein
VQVYDKKYININLKFRNKKNTYEKKDAHWYIVTSLLIKQFMEHLMDVTSFRLSKSHCPRPVLYKHTNYFGSVFPNRLYLRVYKTKFPTHVRIVFFQFSVCHTTLQFLLTLINFLMFLTVAMLSRHLSPVNCRSRNPEENVT